jgi:hypothetical protein
MWRSVAVAYGFDSNNIRRAWQQRESWNDNIFWGIVQL